MPDGLYRVCWRDVCAGFVIRQGTVAECAPVLRKRIAYWLTIAERVGP